MFMIHKYFNVLIKRILRKYISFISLTTTVRRCYNISRQDLLGIRAEGAYRGTLLGTFRYGT
jgi:hypothetical protein